MDDTNVLWIVPLKKKIYAFPSVDSKQSVYLWNYQMDCHDLWVELGHKKIISEWIHLGSWLKLLYSLVENVIDRKLSAAVLFLKWHFFDKGKLLFDDSVTD